MLFVEVEGVFQIKYETIKFFRMIFKREAKCVSYRR